MGCNRTLVPASFPPRQGPNRRLLHYSPLARERTRPGGKRKEIAGDLRRATSHTPSRPNPPRRTGLDATDNIGRRPWTCPWMWSWTRTGWVPVIRMAFQSPRPLSHGIMHDALDSVLLTASAVYPTTLVPDPGTPCPVIGDGLVALPRI